MRSEPSAMTQARAWTTRLGQDDRLVAWLGLVLVAAAGAVILRLGQGLIFLSDEWHFIVARLDWNADAFLTPHNEHLHAGPVLIYKILFSTVGIDHYWPYRVVAVLGHIGCVVLLFALVRRRHGALAAGLAMLPLLAFGPGWEIVLWPFMVGFTGSLAAGLGSLLLLDRHTRRADVAACALLVVAVASSSLGLAFAFGILVELLLRRDGRRRAWIAVIPVVAYAAWYVAYNLHPNRQGPLEWLEAPGFMARSVVGTVAALVGAPLGVETVARPDHELLVNTTSVLTVALVGLAAWRIVARGRRTPRLAMLIVTLGCYWGLLSISRAYTGFAYTSRYIYPAAFLLVLLAFELGARGRPSGRALAVLAVLGTAAGVMNAHWLRKDARFMRADARMTTAQLGALEIVGRRVDPTFVIDKRRTAAVPPLLYFDALRRLRASPGDSPRELLAAPEYARRAADDVLVRANRIRPIAYAGATRRLLDVGRPAVRFRLLRSVGADVRRNGGCLTVRPANGAAAIEVLLPREGAVVRDADVVMRLRRYAAEYGTPSATWTTAEPAWISAPRDSVARRWRLALSAGRGFTAC
jgi:hypothetical protein